MNGENIMFKLFLLFFFFVGCEASKVDIGGMNARDSTAPIEDIVEFENCGYSTGMHSCNFTFLNEENEEVNLYDFYESTIVLDFSTMWCYWCQQAAYDIPDTVELFKDDDIVYITLLVENWTGQVPSQLDLKEWVAQFELNEPVLAAPKEEIIDSSEVAGFGVTAWPTFIFIDKEMIISSSLSGYSKEMINMSITDAL
jgi:peroxiredoxin